MKKLLILGGNYSTVLVVKYAQSMGIHTVVTSMNPNGEAKEIADEAIDIDVTDHETLVDYIKKNNIDGVMTGASEFHILNMIQLCKKAGLAVYATEEQWNTCQNKLSFKKLCRDNNVPCVREFYIKDNPDTFDYPVIVKPSDGCSARGITVCKNVNEFELAAEKALENSTEKKLIIEKFIENKGTTMSVRYIAVDGELYLEAVGDRYVLDSNNGKALITAAAFYPSKYTDFYIKNIDEKVKKMFKNLGLKNGVLFMESIATPDGIWFYEMGLRISGGMTYKITEQTNDVNELKMLINYAVSGTMCTKEDTKKIDPHFNGYISASISLPLREGTISKITGIDKIKSYKDVGDITVYWSEGETILPKHIGTLDQLFARIPIITKGKDKLNNIILAIKENISVLDENGDEMIIWSKLEEIHQNYSN